MFPATSARFGQHGLYLRHGHAAITPLDGTDPSTPLYILSFAKPKDIFYLGACNTLMHHLMASGNFLPSAKWGAVWLKPKARTTMREIEDDTISVRRRVETLP
jgi:hypothetical protein